LPSSLARIARRPLEIDLDEGAAPRITGDLPKRRPLRVGMINNPQSGRNVRRGLLGKVRELLRAQPQVEHFEEDSFDGIGAAIRELIEREAEIVVVNGGDGTVQAVLTGMLRSPADRLPILAVLPGGTTNTTARNVGYGKRPLEALQHLISLSSLGRLPGSIEKRAVVRVDVDDTPEPHYAMFFGAGAVYHGIVFARRHIESRGVRGEYGAALALATFIGKICSGSGGTLFPPVQASICIDGERLAAAPYFGILTSTMNEQFLGMSPYWGVGPGPLRFSSLSNRPRHLMRAVPPILRGRASAYLRPEFGYRSSNVNCVELTLDSGFTLDGELFPPSNGNAVSVVLTGRQCAYFLRAQS
jgi:Diacylglycerol kinase catalytic domain